MQQSKAWWMDDLVSLKLQHKKHGTQTTEKSVGSAGQSPGPSEVWGPLGPPPRKLQLSCIFHFAGRQRELGNGYKKVPHPDIFFLAFYICLRPGQYSYTKFSANQPYQVHCTHETSTWHQEQEDISWYRLYHFTLFCRELCQKLCEIILAGEARNGFQLLNQSLKKSRTKLV